MANNTLDDGGGASTSGISERIRLVQEYIFWSGVERQYKAVVEAGRHHQGWDAGCEDERSLQLSSHMAQLYQQKLIREKIPPPDWSDRKNNRQQGNGAPDS